MSAPDYRIHLRPGVDLITADDVLEWQADMVLAWAPDVDGRMPAGTLLGLLRARLDRERVQACRRAALAEWRRYRDGLEDCFERGGCRECERRRADALAFRAAARGGR